MADTVGDFLLKRLSQWGVRRVFGYPGDGIMGASGRFGPGMQFVQARHEELAAFVACAHAKFTGEVGICMATSGPGPIHLLNGLYDATLNLPYPMELCLVGDARETLRAVIPMLSSEEDRGWREEIEDGVDRWWRVLGGRAMQMSGIHGLVTIARVRKEWGAPKFEASQCVPDFPYAEYARPIGLGGIRVDDPGLVGAAWEEALAADRPTLLEMVTDPDAPPQPPHVTLKQARHYLSALLHRDSDRDSVGIIAQSFKESWETLFPPGSVPG